MKKIIVVLTTILCSSNAFAHYLWVETSPSGSINQTQTFKIRFGEYTHGAIEKVNSDAFVSASKFSVWVVSPNGSKKVITVVPKEDYYLGSFTPNQEGNYTIVVDNKNMDVLDYTEYDFGIFKPQYHAKASVQVGKKINTKIATNVNGIELINFSTNDVKQHNKVTLQLLFKGKPLDDNEVNIYIADLWGKKLITDKEGKVSFTLPWKTLYTVEATYNEKVPGKYKNKEYEFIWQCATYAFKL
jgi:uncharacterized GH25 family protein